MAARLAILMIQSPAPGPEAAKLSDAIVGELIGKPGLDLMMVESRGIADQSSTDRLTLESLPKDVAVLDWAAPDQIETKLRQVDPTWTRSRHADDPTIPVAPSDQKRMYAFDLHQIESTADLERKLRKLLESNQVKTIPLFVAGKSAPLQISDDPTSKIEADPAEREVDVTPGEVTSPRSDSDHATSAFDLDELVDELDRMDP